MGNFHVFDAMRNGESLYLIVQEFRNSNEIEMKMFPLRMFKNMTNLLLKLEFSPDFQAKHKYINFLSAACSEVKIATEKGLNPSVTD